MKKNYLYLIGLCATCFVAAFLMMNSCNTPTQNKEAVFSKGFDKPSKIKTSKKTVEAKAEFTEQRILHEFNMQKNPQTGLVTKEAKQAELQMAHQMRRTNTQTENVTYIYENRGPTNLGGRTRTIVVDKSDASGNTILAGGINSGVFRTTNGGQTWTKVSNNNDIHSVTTIAQDPRPGFQNIWYYATGEALFGSTNLGSTTFLGNGLWRSTNNGVTWSQIPNSGSNQGDVDSVLDVVSHIQVHPVTGDLFIASFVGIYRFDGTDLFTELQPTNINAFNNNYVTDLKITPSGRVYAALHFDEDTALDGVWTLANGVTGTANWQDIAFDGNPTGWNDRGRIVLAIAPSNENLVYALFADGTNGVEADLWRWNLSTLTWTDFSGRLPDEPGGDLSGNDPFAIQQGYDLVVSVKPDNPNFVVIGGTNAYKITNIETDSQFQRIGGYLTNTTYELYSTPGFAQHHPDVHALVFSETNPNIMYSGTDGGIHVTTNINNSQVDWTSLNNNYQTYQFYHVALDNGGSNIVLGGTQDNGTVAGGTDLGAPTNTIMSSVLTGDGAASAISRDNACLPFFKSVQNGVIVRDCPGQEIEITPSGSSSQFVTYFYLDPDNNNALYYAGNNVMYSTTNSSGVTSNSWTNLGAIGAQGNNITVFEASRGAYNPASSYLLIGTAQGNVGRLQNPQNAVNFNSLVDITPPNMTVGSYVSSIAVHPTNSNIAMVTVANYGVQSIFYTTNVTSNTPTWNLVERNLADFSIRSTTITSVNGQTKFFVGTSRGLYSTSNPLTNDWTIESPNQLGFSLISALRYRSSDATILVGTHGDGMWQANVDSTLSIDDTVLSSSSFQLYPNPVRDNRFSISLAENSNEPLKVSLFDMKGNLIYKLKENSLESSIITVQPDVILSSGTYLLMLEQNGKKTTKQVIFE